MTDLIIRKAHPIIEAGYRLSLAEQRIILLSLAKLDNRNIEQSKVTLYAKDYAQHFGISEKIAYRDLLNASKRLYDRSIILKGEDETTEFRWIESRTKYHKGEGRISFEFSRRVLPYLFELDKRLGYTQYHLLSVSGFNSTYSIRIYELCKKLQGMAKQIVELEEIRRVLQIDDKYKEFKILKRDVLSPAFSEINEKSDLFIEVEQLKRGRAIHALHFTIKPKQAVQSTEKTTKSRLIHGVFAEIPRPQVAKNSQAEWDWANKNLNLACKQIREEFNLKSPVSDNYQKLPTEWLKVLKKYYAIVDRYSAREVSDELYRRKLEK